MYVIKSEKGYLCDEDLADGYTSNINQALLYEYKSLAQEVINDGKGGIFPKEWVVEVETMEIREKNNGD